MVKNYAIRIFQIGSKSLYSNAGQSHFKSVKPFNRHSREGGNPNPSLPLQTAAREGPPGCRNENTLRIYHGRLALSPSGEGLDSRFRGNDGWSFSQRLKCICPV